MPRTQADYQQQLSEKELRLNQQFSLFAHEQSLPELQVFTSAPTHYRMRAEFRVWHEGDDLFYIMFEPGTRNKYRVETFPVACELINTLMPEVLNYVKSKPELRHRLFQIDYLATQTGQAAISLLYHRQLDDQWINAAEEMRAHLQSFGQIELIGRARKQKLLVHNDRVIETLQVNGKAFQFEQIENSFTQPNAQVNEKMLEWALSVTQGSCGDLLELYCGNGNFSLPLAQSFQRVLGTEISRTSVMSAQTNIALNSIDNVVIARMSAEEVSAAMKGEFASRRVDELKLEDYDFKTVLVDPPRAGLDDATLGMVQAYDNILYISCNPDTLIENLKQLCKTHRIVHRALFDQFPFTHHTEAGVYLTKR